MSKKEECLPINTPQLQRVDLTHNHSLGGFISFNLCLHYIKQHSIRANGTVVSKCITVQWMGVENVFQCHIFMPACEAGHSTAGSRPAFPTGLWQVRSTEDCCGNRSRCGVTHHVPCCSHYYDLYLCEPQHRLGDKIQQEK